MKGKLFVKIFAVILCICMMSQVVVSAQPSAVSEADSQNVVVIANLDGTENGIIASPISSAYLDVNLNPADSVLLYRPQAGLPVADLSSCNVLSFNMWVEDNGAWEDYKNHIAIDMVLTDGEEPRIPQEDMNSALEAVVPGTTVRVSVPLIGLSANNLNYTRGLYLKLLSVESDKSLHIKIDSIQGEYSPAIGQAVSFAKLNGSESGIIVTPSLSAYLDTNLNPADSVLLYRLQAELPAADLSSCNVLTFNMWVEDNGAWEDYKNHIAIDMVLTEGEEPRILQDDVDAALASVVPGETVRISIPLASVSANNLNYTRGLYLRFLPLESDKSLHIKIDSMQGEYRSSVRQTVSVARLDGNEWNIVNPHTINETVYNICNFDRYMNPAVNAAEDVFDYILVFRESAGLPAADLSSSNMLSFNMWVEDNGAWEAYKNNIAIDMVLTGGEEPRILQDDVNAALDAVVPGKTVKISIPLASVSANNLYYTRGFYLRILPFASENNLHIKIDSVRGEYKETKPQLESKPVYDSAEQKPLIKNNALAVEKEFIIERTADQSAPVYSNVTVSVSDFAEDAYVYMMLAETDFATDNTEAKWYFGLRLGENGWNAGLTTGINDDFAKSLHITDQPYTNGGSESVTLTSKVENGVITVWMNGKVIISNYISTVYNINSAALRAHTYNSEVSSFDDVNVWTANENYGKLGDVNGDYSIDILDFVRMKKIILSPETEFAFNDAVIAFNPEGTLGSSELTTLRKYLFGLIEL